MNFIDNLINKDLLDQDWNSIAEIIKEKDLKIKALEKKIQELSNNPTAKRKVSKLKKEKWNTLIDLIKLYKLLIPKLPTLPVLKTVKIYWENGDLKMCWTDMEIVLTLTIWKTDKSDIVSISYDKLLNTLQATKWDIELKNNWVDVWWVFLESEFASDERPSIPTFEKDSEYKLINFSNNINKVLPFISKKNFSPVIACLNIQTDNNIVKYVWTNSFHLAEFKQEQNIWDLNINIYHWITTILSKLKIDDCVLELNKDKNIARIVKDNFEIVFYLTIWNYPEYDREEIIPKQFNTSFKIWKDINDKIKKLKWFTKDNDNIDFKITNWNIELIKKDSKNTEMKDQFTIEWGSEIDLIFNQDYIMNCIAFDDMYMNIVDNTKPIVFTKENFTAVIRQLLPY